jgi:putative phosphonate catabolism associated alcohol dehydrogenase
MTDRITALEFDGPYQPFRLTHSARPDLGEGEALIRVTLATVCGSDWHTIAGLRTEPTPCVLGHESVGVVEEVCGTIPTLDGAPLAAGDRVVWSIAASCGLCDLCTWDVPQKCRSLKKYGHARHDATRGPSGSFATHVHTWPGTAFMRVPSDVPDLVAAPASCATATVMAVAERSPPLHNRTLAIFGMGLLGLTACAIAHTAGASVIAIDPNPIRLELAKRFGAAEVMLSTVEPPTRTVDVTWELSGTMAATRASFDWPRVGGCVVWAGAVRPIGDVSVNPESLIRRCLQLVGVHNYQPTNLKMAVNFLADTWPRYPFVELVDVVGTLDQMPKTLPSTNPIRIGLRP